MLASPLPPVILSEGGARRVGGRGWRAGPVPPQGQPQGLFGKQRLDQGQVQARNAAAVQYQDLVPWTQTCGDTTAGQRLRRGDGRGGGGLLEPGDTFVKSQSVREDFVDNDPAVFLNVYVSRYRKA